MNKFLSDKRPEMMWGKSIDDPAMVAEAAKIAEVLKRNVDPMFEADLKDLANVASIGHVWKILKSDYGIVRIHFWHRNENNNKLYFYEKLIS